MPATELGFLAECEPYLLASNLFPSKVGGKPAWLSLSNLPTSEELKCKKCEQIMIFLCQVYAPFEDAEENSEIWINNFHRTIFIFICRNPNCNERNISDNIIVYRSAIPRENYFYSYYPPTEKTDAPFDTSKWCSLCKICGIEADKRCGKCKSVYYCSRQHQVIDWKNGHNTYCLKGVSDPQTESTILFPEWELFTETEHIEDEPVDELKELEKFEQLKVKGEVGTLQEVSDSELSSHVNAEVDKTFLKFKKKISHYPDQVLRYSRGGNPLLIAKEPILLWIPNCELCGGPRQFEFQIMPQILSKLKEYSLDFGVLLIYTCKNSCVGTSKNSYKKEFVFKQDVSLSDSINAE